MHKEKVKIEARITNWWLIIMSLLLMLSGLLPIFGGGNWAGDYMIASLTLFLLLILSFITLVSGIFLLQRKRWSFTTSLITLILTIIIVIIDFIRWLKDEGITTFGVIFSNDYTLLEVFSVAVILVILLVTLTLLLLNRRNFFITLDRQETNEYNQ
jgi:hypothetical protein